MKWILNKMWYIHQQAKYFLLLQGKDLKFWPIIFPQVAVGGRGGKSL